MSRHQNNSSLGFLFGGADTRPKVSANTFATGSNRTVVTLSPTDPPHATHSLSLDLYVRHTCCPNTDKSPPPRGRTQISIFGGYSEEKSVKKTETAAPSTSAPVVKKGTSSNVVRHGIEPELWKLHYGSFDDENSCSSWRKNLYLDLGGYAEETKKAVPVLQGPIETKKDNAPAPTVVKTASPIKATRHVSSNRFATGSNQNCIIYHRSPTARVHVTPWTKSDYVRLTLRLYIFLSFSVSVTKELNSDFRRNGLKIKINCWKHIGAARS